MYNNYTCYTNMLCFTSHRQIHYYSHIEAVFYHASFIQKDNSTHTGHTCIEIQTLVTHVTQLSCMR